MSDTNELSPRVAVQVRLALAAMRGNGAALASLQPAARRLGLTHAEIDAALTGRSFEARACAAIRLARAIRSGSPEVLQEARRHAAEFGLCPVEIEQVGQIALEDRPRPL